MIDRKENEKMNNNNNGNNNGSDQMLQQLLIGLSQVLQNNNNNSGTPNTYRKESRLVDFPEFKGGNQDPIAVLVFGRDMSLDRTVWDSPRPWTRRCNVLGHLGHIYNIYIYSKLNLKIKN